MAGQYHIEKNNFTLSQKKNISKWIVDSIQNESWKEGNDLHIDDIIHTEISEDTWIKISLNLISFAHKELFRLGYEKIIPIVFIPLYGDENERGINFDDIFEINSELDITPPSLFVCSMHWEGFIDAYSDRKIIGEIKILDDLFYIYYYEKLHDNGLEYVRNISILPKERVSFLKENDWKV
jgi:hypothetical protein